MNSDILSGAVKGKKGRVHFLTKRSGDGQAKRRGEKVNKAQKDGRRRRHDHPARPHEQKVEGEGR